MVSFHEDQQIRWNRRHIAVSTTAALLACVLCVVFSVSYSGRAGGDGTVVVNERINPNTAEAGSLMRLPNIGPKRAEAIIAYRNSVGEGEIAFETAQDMEKIRGIGPKTVEGMKSELCFD